MTPITRPLVEHLPDEPPPRQPSAASVTVSLAGRALVLALSIGAMAPLWVLYLGLRLFFPRPPHVPHAARTLAMLHHALTEQPGPPGLALRQRLAALLSILLRWILTPLPGLAWCLDEALYGRQLRQVKVEAPIFELSAARSGSTQLAHYLEDDPAICSPSTLQSAVPYLWAWKLARWVVARGFDPEWVRRPFMEAHPPNYRERHELDPFRMDTLEIIFMSIQFGFVPMALGPRVYLQEYRPDVLTPSNRGMWMEEFVPYVDALARRTLLLDADRRGGPGGRLMLKGHFLAVADALEGAYPDARFLTVIRAPDKRLQSVINFHKVQPYDEVMGSPAWAWVREEALEIEVSYCREEQRWFTREGGARRCVVIFDDYVKDLDSTVHKVYRDCLDKGEPSLHVPRTHAERKRSHYAVDRSLEQLGIDAQALRQELADYVRWCSRSG